MAINTPVTGEGGRHAGGAGAVTIAVKEGEVGRHNIRTILHSDRQLAREMGLTKRDAWEQIIPWSSAGHSCVGTGGIGHQNLAESGECTEIISREVWQIINDQLECSSCRSL